MEILHWIRCTFVHFNLFHRFMYKYVEICLVSLHFADTPTKLGTSSEREVLCVSLRKDPKLGLGMLHNWVVSRMWMWSFAVQMCLICIHAGIVIVGEEAVGHFDLGIFVASIVPNGPADRDGRIRPGMESWRLSHDWTTFHFVLSSKSC